MHPFLNCPSEILLFGYYKCLIFYAFRCLQPNEVCAIRKILCINCEKMSPRSYILIQNFRNIFAEHIIYSYSRLDSMIGSNGKLCG